MINVLLSIIFWAELDDNTIGFKGKGITFVNPPDEGTSHELTTGQMPFFATPKTAFEGVDVLPPLVERKALQLILTRWSNNVEASRVCASNPCGQPTRACDGFPRTGQPQLLSITCDKDPPHSITKVVYRDKALPENKNHVRLHGAIPMEIGRLTELREFELESTDIGGSLPKEFQLLTKLEQLRLVRNRMGGSVPEWIGKLTALRDLDFSSNFFSGPFPESLGDLKHLIRFKAFENCAYTLLEVKTKSLKKCKKHSKTLMDGPDPEKPREYKCPPYGFTGTIPARLVRLTFRMVCVFKLALSTSKQHLASRSCPTWRFFMLMRIF
jgi:hypothetical protein